MSFQILPERQAEQLVVGRSACSDDGEEAAPCRGHAATDAIEVKAELLRWVEQLSGCFIERELTGRWLLKDAFAHQMPEHPLQGVGVAPCLLGKRFNVSCAGGNLVGDPQGCHNAYAPGRAEIAQRAEIGAGPWCLVTWFPDGSRTRAATRSGPVRTSS